TWASHTISAMQSGRLLSRGLILSSIDDPDLMRHSPNKPAATAPGGDSVTILSFKGAVTTDAGPTDQTDGGPRNQYWHRYPARLTSLAANQAILAWATNGELIGLAMKAHLDSVNIKQAHRTLSTGVIAHTINFHESFDIG